ncbi:hypothetical protein CPC08DRAFT_562188 [Agrocybe pediades]|nr:hypothetical protein CPC08DRAFT_562188 [Agrocybe pediades]
MSLLNDVHCGLHRSSLKSYIVSRKGRSKSKRQRRHSRAEPRLPSSSRPCRPLQTEYLLFPSSSLPNAFSPNSAHPAEYGYAFNECVDRLSPIYWDWTLDMRNGSSILNSPVFDPTTGFGGDGVPCTFNISSLLFEAIIESSQIHLPSFVGCVQDGPSFANFKVHLRQGKAIQDYGLMQGIDNEFTESLSREAVEKALAIGPADV